MPANIGNILQFSEELAGALEANIEEIIKVHSDFQWQTPNFVVILKTRFFSDGWLHFEWHNILEAYPKPHNTTASLSDRDAAGYIPVGVGWQYNFAGTSTTNLPSKEYRRIILDEIRDQVAFKRYFTAHSGEMGGTIPMEVDEPIKSRFDILDL